MSEEAQLRAEAERQAKEGLRGPKPYKHFCSKCGEHFRYAIPKQNVFTLAGARDTQILGWCEKCFDATFAEEG